MQVTSAKYSRDESSIEFTFDDGKICSFPTDIPARVLTGRNSAYAQEAKGWLDLGNTPDSGITLEQVKTEKIGAIDAKTSELIKAGFAYGTNHFSMSEAAQRNWAALAAANANNLLVFPMAISTVDEDAHVLQDETDLLGFLGAYLIYQTSPDQPLNSGRMLKAQVNAASTIEEVEAIVDDR